MIKKPRPPKQLTEQEEPTGPQLPLGVNPPPAPNVTPIVNLAERRAEGVRLEALRLAVQIGGPNVMENTKKFYTWLDEGYLVT